MASEVIILGYDTRTVSHNHSNDISVFEVTFTQIHANKIEPMTFRTLVGRSTTEPQERIWQVRSQYWVMIHRLYHTITEWH